VRSPSALVWRGDFVAIRQSQERRSCGTPVSAVLGTTLYRVPAAPNPPPSRPAEMLSGLELSNGWVVVGRIPSLPDGTGGTFSTPYTVERGGQRAFLKAIDFTRALADEDPARALEQLTRIFNFERDLVKACTDQRMRNVIRVLDEGSTTVPNGGAVPRVNYLIFELADGDIRRIMRLSTDLDAAWAFRSLKEVALGLTQLHGAGIAHQDLKPSNVLDVQGVYKVADLGRASRRGEHGPFDNLRCAGDPNYVTPEQMYGFALNDWDARRRAGDLYHLGGLLLFLLTGVTASAALYGHLAPAHLPPPWGTWGGTFDQVIVHLREATGRITDCIPTFSDAQMRESIVTRFVELCDPDPRTRGHPKNRVGAGSQYSLERYVSHFDALSARARRRVVRVLRE
jgi:serine/threonine protein kinase